MKKFKWLVTNLVLILTACSNSVVPADWSTDTITPPSAQLGHTPLKTQHPSITFPTSTSIPSIRIPTASIITASELVHDENSVLFIFGDGFDYRHYDGTRTALERAGYQVVVTSNTLEPIEGHITVHGFEIVSRHGQTTPFVNADLLLEDVQVSNYLGIVFISDAGTMGDSSPELQRLLLSATNHGVVLAAQEYGIYLLADAGLLGGKKVTANPLICREMEVNYNAICTLMPVQRDDGIVTADPTMSTVSFARAIVGEIEERKP